MMHWLRKLCSTVQILTTLAMARTFGRYVHPVWDGRMSYAEYEWRGRHWAFPTEPIEQPAGYDDHSGDYWREAR